MRKVLNELNLVIIDTHGFKIDFKEYDIVDFTGVEIDDVFYKNKWISISAEKNLIEVLKKGCGVFYEGKVYYSVNLAPEVMNKGKKKLEIYISNMIHERRIDKYGIQKYLTSPDYEQFVRNAMLFYDKNFDIEFIKRKLSGRVKDVDAFIEYLESRETRAVC